MNEFSLKTELRQELRLTPQLLQSMEILQMTSQELLDYINRMTEENPLLEREDPAQLHSDYEEFIQRISWLNSTAADGSLSHSDTDLPEHGTIDQALDGLTAFLCDQLERKRLPKPLLALTRYISELLDENGYLSQEDLDELAGLNIPAALIDQALETLQSLEPAGIGARSLSECLLLQLERQGGVSTLLRELVSRFLPNLGSKHYGPICKELGVTVAEITAAEAIIAGLDPHPGRAFQPEEPTLYVRPDIFVAELDGELRAVLNEYYLPRVSISDYYVRLLKSQQEKETLDYLRRKLQQANGLLSGLERRNRTLQRCADAILATQHDYFAQKSTSLVPMTLFSLADMLSLHPSTVSRATKGKYLQCRQGTFPLRYFFTRSLGTPEHSTQQIRQQILSLLRNEDPTHPLSDQKICLLLEKEGIHIARRTAAKYRAELGFASSTARKQSCTGGPL